MRPTQRHGRTRWPTAPHISLRQIFGVPQLLADHATFVGKLFHRGNERHWIASRSNLVMAAFPRQNRPGAAHAPAIESAAVLLLPITIMIVAAPARTLRQVALEYAIDDFDRITDDGMVRSTNAQPHQVKKITADNVPCRM